MDARDEVNHAAVAEAVRRQHEDPEEHDRSLIAERLSWTPEERLEANAAFVRWYLAVRPQGPLIPR
jgi:hypothetical protein